MQYLMALEDLRIGPETSFNQLNDGQATWQVGPDRSAAPVDPDDDLGITSVDHLATVTP